MDSTFLVYLWTRLDSFTTLMHAIMILSGISVGVILVAWAQTYDMEEAAKVTKLLKRFFYIWCGCALLNLAIPSQKDALMIYVLPKVAQSQAIEDTKQLLESLPKTVRIYIERYIGVTLEQGGK